MIFSINIQPSIQTNVSHYQLLDATKYICLTEGTGDSLTQSTYLAKNKQQAKEIKNYVYYL